MIDPIKPNLPVENTRLKNLFLVLIFTFITKEAIEKIAATLKK
jgi:hypothetical protein